MECCMRALTRTLPLVVWALLFAFRQPAFPRIRTMKTFIDYIQPMPLEGGLSTNVWGAAEVGARSTNNGLEDPTMKQWNYWDGTIIKGKDGKYHLFACRWNQAAGHGGWGQSKAVHAVSDKATGPYQDKGLLWPDNEGQGTQRHRPGPARRTVRRGDQRDTTRSGLRRRLTRGTVEAPRSHHRGRGTRLACLQ